MFTGIVEGKGRVRSITTGGRGFVLAIEAPFDLGSDNIGDSVAVNGICLTITGINGNVFTADVSKETLSRTNLGDVKAETEVNLERAMKLGDRFGGHIVTGHIDGTGRIRRREPRGESVYFEIEADEELLRFVVEKGSVSVDGISLTVNSVTGDFFSLNIIPHTLKITTLGSRNMGDSVNVETDILGKYIEKLALKGRGAKGVNMEILKEYGFA